MKTLRMHQLAKATSLQHGHPHSPTSMTQYLPYLRSQDSYAAAVRRTRGPVSYQFTSISHSRNSSPLSHSLMRNLSNLHLNSKGSSTSSTASDTASERDRSTGKARNASHSGNSRSSSDGRHSGTSSPVPPRTSGRAYRTSSTPPAPEHRRYSRNPPWPKAIPGMPLQGDSEPRRGEGEGRVSEGGWIKVQNTRKPYRQSTSKPGRERPRGSWRGRRTF